MFCGKCGASLPDDAVKCPACGAPARIRPSRKKRGEDFFQAPAADMLDGYQEEADSVSEMAEAEPAGTNIEKRQEQTRPRQKKTDRPAKPARAGDAADEAAAQKRKKRKSGSAPASDRQGNREKMSESEKPRRRSGENASAGSGSRTRSDDLAEREKPAAAMPAAAAEAAVIFASREDYVASLPFGERMRRRLLEAAHERAEAQDEKRMLRHMERAGKYYAEEDEEDEDWEDDIDVQPVQRPVTEGTAEQERAVQNAPGQKESAEKELQIPAQKVPAEELSAEKPAAHRTAAETPAQKAPAEEVSAEKPAAHRTAAETAPAQETPAEEVSAEKPAAHRTAAETGPAQDPGEAGFAQDREPSGQLKAPEDDELAMPGRRSGAQIISLRKARRDQEAEEEYSDTEEPAQEPAAQKEQTFDADAEKARLDREAAEREERLRKEEEAAQARRVRAEEAEAQAREERARAQEEARRNRELALLAQRAREEQAAAARSDREQQLEDARLIRRYQEDMPDQVDQILGKYGMSKETAVRLATLFLIAILSVIYVLGRGKQPSGLEDVPVAGEGMTASPSYADPDGADGEGAADGSDSGIPTGGGEFDSSDQ